MTAHQCSKCNYTTNRIYNLERHTRTCKKSELQEKGSNLQEKGSCLQKKGSLLQKKGSFHDHSSQTNIPTCQKCNKTFTRNSNLKIHLETCDGTVIGMCKICKEMFNSKSTLYRHKKICKVKEINNQNEVTQPTIVQNITIINNIDNSTNNNIVNLLSFPIEDSSNFDFVTNKITQSMMKKCVTSNKAEVGFNKFMGAVLDHPENKFVMKSNPNVNYSKIHVGDGKWILAPDIDVFPIITHHMTTAALAKLEEFKRSLKFMCENFTKYVNTINTDDEGKEYQNTIQRLKLMVVNVTKEIEAMERETLTNL